MLLSLKANACWILDATLGISVLLLVGNFGTGRWCLSSTEHRGMISYGIWRCTRRRCRYRSDFDQQGRTATSCRLLFERSKRWTQAYNGYQHAFPLLSTITMQHVWLHPYDTSSKHAKIPIPTQHQIWSRRLDGSRGEAWGIWYHIGVSRNGGEYHSWIKMLMALFLLDWALPNGSTFTEEIMAWKCSSSGYTKHLSLMEFWFSRYSHLIHMSAVPRRMR